jgi:periplasmic divalent cation tolerance protein
MEAATEFSCVLVTAPNITTARKLAAAVLNEKLAACANLIPKIESHYWWKGALESSAEVLILFKTKREKLKPLEACILQNHPYETAECIAFNLSDGTPNYLAWIAESVKGK